MSEAHGGFVLYGGTALSLHLGHRESEDFDFFCGGPLEHESLLHGVPLLEGAEIRQKKADTLELVLPESGAHISFFGGLSPRIRAVFPPVQADNGLAVAAVGDAFGNKCGVVQQRAALRDYFDIWAILEQTSYTLSDGLAFARAMYGSQFAPLETLRALSYFEELDRPLEKRQRKRLLEAVQSVDLAELPSVQPFGPIGTAGARPLASEGDGDE